MMNDEIKKKWIAALRSGEYKQGNSVLKREDDFCCLGVLCDLHRKETNSGKWAHKTPTGSLMYECSEHDSSYVALPVNVVDWANGSNFKDWEYLDSSGSFGKNLLSRSLLSALNDNGTKFEEIAEIIESNF